MTPTDLADLRRWFEQLRQRGYPFKAALALELVKAEEARQESANADRDMPDVRGPVLERRQDA